MNSIDIGLWIMYIMLGAATVVAIILPIVNLFNNPKSLIRIGIGAAALVLAFFLAFSLSDATLTTKWIAQEQTGDDLKLIGAGLVMLYVFLFGSIIAMVVSEVTKLFK